MAVSSIKKFIFIFWGLVEVLLFGGIVYGWPSLVFVLKEEGYFTNQCGNQQSGNGTSVPDGQKDSVSNNCTSKQAQSCASQDEQFNLIFTITVALVGVLQTLNGILFDKLGTLATRIIGSCSFICGALLVTFSHPGISSVLYPAMIFLLYGGFIVLMTNIQLANLLIRGRSLMVCFLNGALDSSTAVFLVIKLMYENGVSLTTAFGGLSAASVMVLISTLMWLPLKKIPWPLPAKYDIAIAGMCRKTHEDKLNPIHQEINNKDIGHDNKAFEHGLDDLGNIGKSRSHYHFDEEDVSVIKMILSPLYMGNLLWLTCTHLKVIFFLGNFNTWISYLTDYDSTKVSAYTTVLNLMTSFGALVALIGGVFLERKTTSPFGTIEYKLEKLYHFVPIKLLNILLGVVLCVCASIPLIELQYFTFVVFVFHRAFNYGPSAAFIAQMFPPQHFGLLYGLTLALISIFGLLQHPLFLWIRGPLANNSMWVFILLMCLTVCSLIDPLYIIYYCRKETKRLNNKREEEIHEPHNNNCIPALSSECTTAEMISYAPMPFTNGFHKEIVRDNHIDKINAHNFTTTLTVDPTTL